MRSVVACSKHCSSALKHPRVSCGVQIGERILKGPCSVAGCCPAEGPRQAAFEEHGGAAPALPSCKAPACLPAEL